MKSSAIYEAVIVAVVSTVTLTFLAKSWGRVASIQFHSDTILLCALITVLVVVVTVIRRSDRSLKLRLDLLFRMGYQGPFVQEIRRDEEEKALYGASILRKLRDLAELNRSTATTSFVLITSDAWRFWRMRSARTCGWVTFRDEVAQYFAEEILSGKIARHVIDDHYKGMWEDLVAAAELATARRKRSVVS